MVQPASTRIRAVFQPFHSLRADATPTGEILTRPESGISPQAFFAGLTVTEEQAILRWQLDIQQRLREAGNWTASVNVNNHLLASDTLRESFLESISDLAGPVIFEFTETHPMPPVETSNQLLRALRDLGHHSALDDFGTGMSGVSLLVDYDFDIVKIDRSLIGDVATRPELHRTLRWIHETLTVLEKDHVVEGIENEETFQRLVDLGFVDFQGFHFHEPSDLATFGVSHRGVDL